MRRLVQLDPETLRFTEVDRKRLRREGQALRAYLNGLTSENDRLGLRAQVGQLVDAVLRGARTLPLDLREVPFGRESTEGLLSREFEDLYAAFFVTALGSHREPPQIVEKEGNKWAWMDFED
jgi:hypothetical protein